MTDKKGTLEGLPLVSKLALVFFIIGKALSFMTFFTFFVDLELAKIILIMYTGSIALSVVLALYQMFSNKEEEKIFKVWQGIPRQANLSYFNREGICESNRRSVRHKFPRIQVSTDDCP